MIRYEENNLTSSLVDSEPAHLVALSYRQIDRQMRVALAARFQLVPNLAFPFASVIISSNPS